MKISIEKFTNDFVEVKASEALDKDKVSAYLKKLYGSSPAYDKNTTAVSAEVRQQVAKVADCVAALGLIKFADLKKKFESETLYPQALLKLMLIKERMEGILFIMETSGRKPEDIVNQFKDRNFFCHDGTLTNLDGIMAEMLMGENTIESHFALQKKKFIEQVAVEMLRAEKFQGFGNNPGVEIHDVSSLLNSIADRYKLVKKSQQEDVYMTSVFEKDRNLFAKSIDKGLQDPQVVESFIDGVAQRIVDILPYYEPSKEDFLLELTNFLEGMKISPDVLTPISLLQYDEYKAKGYKENVHSVIKNLVMVHLHEKGVINDPEITKAQTILKIEKSCDEDMSAGVLTLDVWEGIEDDGMAEFAIKYIFQNKIELDEESFTDKKLEEILNKTLLSKFSNQEMPQILAYFADIGKVELFKKYWNLYEVTGSKEDYALLEFLCKKNTYNFAQHMYEDSKFKFDNDSLKLAIAGKHSAVIQLILERNKELNFEEGVIDSILKFAVENNILGLVESVLEKGVNVNFSIDGKDPILIWAIKNNRTDIAKLLVERGAEFNTKDTFGNTHLSIATKRGHKDIIQFLIKQGADVNELIDGKDPILIWAIKNNRTDIAKLFIERGAEVNAKDIFGNTPFDGDPILIWAIKNDDIELAKLLIEKGADVNIAGEYGKTPLIVAAEKGHKDIVQLLIDRGANVAGNHILIWAIENNHVDFAKLLIESGAKVNAKDIFGKTPLSMAAKKGHKDIVELLIEQGANVDGDPILIWAIENNHVDWLNFLIEKNANVNVQDNSGKTPLIIAAQSGHTEVVQLLIDRDANVNVQDNYGNTPLSMAAEKGNKEIVKLLIEKGADVNGGHSFRKAPLMQTCDPEIMTLLLLNGANYEDTGQRKISDDIKKTLKEYLALKSQFEKKFIKNLREGLLNGTYENISSFITDFNKNLQDLENEHKTTFTQKLSKFSEEMPSIKLAWYEEFIAEVVGFFKGTGKAKEVELAKLSKHMEKGYYAIQNFQEFKDLSEGLLNNLPKVPQSQGASRGKKGSGPAMTLIMLINHFLTTPYS